MGRIDKSCMVESRAMRNSRSAPNKTPPGEYAPDTGSRDTWEIILSLSVLFVFIVLILTGSTLVADGVGDRTRAYTRSIEFDYVDWILQALAQKVQLGFAGVERLLPSQDSRQVILEYMDLVHQAQSLEREILLIYSDPHIEDPEAASATLNQQLDAITSRLDIIQPVAEEILQSQVADTADDLGLTYGGQSFPPVLFHSTPLPYALIISPRDVIRHDADISLLPGLTIEQITELEDQVEENLDLSALVVPIGGVGVYPTMVQETSNLNWLSEVVSHEWVHNFLTLRPMGISYMRNPELRIMNETTASIAGKEIGRAILEKYYPELVPPDTPPQESPQAPPPVASGTEPEDEPEEPVFDFIKEMRTTRVRVDELLAEGKIDEAEAYMEERRVVFWENGYRIRKLNQAYFAFYGAYADSPGGGAAGTDPVGAAVRQLRAESASLAQFLKRISWMFSFRQLQQAVNQASAVDRSLE